MKVRGVVPRVTLAGPMPVVLCGRNPLAASSVVANLAKPQTIRCNGVVFAQVLFQNPDRTEIPIPLNGIINVPDIVFVMCYYILYGAVGLLVSLWSLANIVPDL